MEPLLVGHNRNESASVQLLTVFDVAGKVQYFASTSVSPDLFLWGHV